MSNVVHFQPPYSSAYSSALRQSHYDYRRELILVDPRRSHRRPKPVWAHAAEYICKRRQKSRSDSHSTRQAYAGTKLLVPAKAASYQTRNSAGDAHGLGDVTRRRPEQPGHEQPSLLECRMKIRKRGCCGRRRDGDRNPAQPLHVEPGLRDAKAFGVRSQEARRNR